MCLLISLLIIIQEIIFLLATIGNISNVIMLLLFSLLIGFILDLSCSIFKEKTSKIIKIVISTIITLIFIVQYIYYDIFETVLIFNTATTGVMALPFIDIIFDSIIDNWLILLLFISPFIFYIVLVLKNKFIFKFNKKLIFVSIVLYLICLVFINLDKDLKNIYYEINIPISNLNNFGLLTTIRLDIQRTIFKFEDKINFNSEILNKTEEDANILEINFDVETDNEEIIEISNYLKNQKPTLKNEYTGVFKDKNLIIILAESFSELAIHQDITPTLYKLYNSGFKFNNYYSPMFLRGTADSEYILDNSLLPVDGIISLEKVVDNYLPYNYANVFKNNDYYISAYHNYDYDYYKRDKYFKNLGYNYLGCGNGLENKMDCNLKIPSDLDLIDSTIDDYITKDKFMTYYVTMSGHVNYDLNHPIVLKNLDKVSNLQYQDKSKYYLATQIELDKALEKLLEQLEKNNKLSDTVIVLVGDHHPYSLSLDEMNELSNYERDDLFEKVKMPLIIYNSEIDNINIDNYCSNLDVLPTILNLFGINYDSRLLLGKDIFSNTSSPIIFHNRSFITEKGKYNALTNDFSGSVSNEYINNIKNEMYYKFKISRLILKNDYYQYLDL